MWNNNSGSQPDWIKGAYEILASHIRERDGGVTHEEARKQLVARTELSKNADADYAIERLLESGWLYEVGDELRVTDPDR